MTRVKDVLNGLTVVLKRDGAIVYASTESGIRPLVDALGSGKDFSGCDAFDKIVGKAAAMLYVLLHVRSVSACVMTHKARQMLQANGIECNADEYVDAIINRRGDGLCPMELAVADIDDLNAALDAISERLKGLESSSK